MMMRFVSRAASFAEARARNFGWDAAVILFARMLQNANGFLLSVIIVRKFGLAAAGSLTIATIATVILGTLCTFGLPYIFAREEADNAIRNTVGLVAWFFAIVIAIPASLSLGFLTGHDLTEVIVIFLLSLAGPFFAQTNVANSLLVLQNRAQFIIFAPLGNLLGLIIGFLFSNTLIEFALVLTACRLTGTLTIFLCLPLAKIHWKAFITWLRQGMRFLTADVINLGADQASVMIASYLMTRPELGIFGLCRQMLTLSDTPGWSRLVTWYPKVYADPHNTLPVFTRQMVSLGIFCGACVAALSVPLGYWIYHLPHFAVLAPLMLCSVPFRYLVGIYDMGLRAIGAVKATNEVTLIRCVLVIVLYGLGIYLAGIYGAIAATIALGMISAWLTRMILRRNMPASARGAQAQPLTEKCRDHWPACVGAVGMTVFHDSLHSDIRSAEEVIPDKPLARFFGFYLRFTPLLWMLGALIPCAAVMLIKLAIEHWPKGRMINFVIHSWIAIAIAQATCSILNGLTQHDLGTGLRNAMSFTAIGWLFGALALAVGNGCHLASPQIARLTAKLGFYIVILSVIALIGTLLGIHDLRMSTPLGMILPSGNATNFYASMTIYQSEDTLGESRTRLILFFPWATALGLGGLAIALISSRVEQSRWRLLGMAGGAIGVVFSWSRIAIAAMVLIAGILIFIKLPRYLQILSATLVAVGIYGLSVVGLDPISLITDMHNAADQARAGSSLARDLIYQKSWEGFLRSPIIGNGWIGESVHRTENLPIGSHSTIYGVLYTGGTVTMACYVLAMMMTLIALIYAIYHWRMEKERQKDAIIGLCLWLSLVLYCPYESLFSLTLPCLFLFTWIGGVIPAGRADKRSPKISRHRSLVFRDVSLQTGSQHPRSAHPPEQTENAEIRASAFDLKRQNKGDNNATGKRGRAGQRFRANSQYRDSGI
jgi:O-antigen/teichoic acid export membrane protein